MDTRPKYSTQDMPGLHLSTYKHLFDHINHGLAIYQRMDDGQDFIIVDMNEKGEQFSGVKIDEVRHKKVTDVFPGINKMGLLGIFQQVYITGSALSLPLAHYSDGWRTQWMENFVFKLPSKHIVAVFQDKTEIKQAQEALKKNQSQFETIVNSSNEYFGLLDVTPDKRLTINFLNKPFIEANRSAGLNFTNGSISGKYLEDFLSETLGFDHAKSNSVITHYYFVLNSRQPISYEEKTNIYGKTIFTEVQLVPILDDTNECTQILYIARNITKYREGENKVRESEEQLEAIFNSVPMQLILVDQNLGIVNMNQYAVDSLGKSLDDIYLHQPGDVLCCINSFNNEGGCGHHRNCKNCMVRESIRQTFNTQKSFRKIETKVNYAKESESLSRDILLSTSYINIGVKALVLVSIDDISEKKELERKLLNTTIEIEERERNRLAQELHDGLGPILSNIQLYFQWLADQDENREFIIEKGNQSLQNAFLTLKEISNNLSPHILHNFGLEVALNTFFEESTRLHEIKIHYQSNLKERIIHNMEINLYRIILELLNNTVKHANAQNINIELKTYPNSIDIYYADNGQGFDLKDVENKLKGHGLTNIGSRVKSMGGTFHLHTKKGFGMDVFMELPLNKKLDQ